MTLQAEEAKENYNSSSATDAASTTTDAASNTDEIEEVSLVKSYQNGVVQELSLNARQKGNCPISDRIMVPSVSLNTPILCSISSSQHIPCKLMVVGFVIVVVGIWGCLLL